MGTSAAKATVKALETKARHDRQNEARDEKALKAAKLALSTLAPSGHTATKKKTVVAHKKATIDNTELYKNLPPHAKKKKKKTVVAHKKVHAKAPKMSVDQLEEKVVENGGNGATATTAATAAGKTTPKKQGKTSSASSGGAASLKFVKQALPILKSTAEKEIQLQSSEKRDAQEVLHQQEAS